MAYIVFWESDMETYRGSDCSLSVVAKVVMERIMHLSQIAEGQRSDDVFT